MLFSMLEIKSDVRCFTLAWLISSFFICPLHAASRSATLTLKNGDRFGGQFLGYSESKGLVWQHDSVKGQMRVLANEAAKLQLAAVSVTNSISNLARVQFTNGDELAIGLSDLNPERLTVETWFAGRLKVQRERLKWLIPGGEGGILYSGPEGIRGWGAALMGVILGDDGIDVGGIVVNEVMPESPAFKSGMQIGDIVTHINGKAFQDRAAMIRCVKEHKVGDKLKVKVMRGDAPKELEVGLAALHWRFENGALVTNSLGSMIGRELKWPSQSDLSFDFAWASMPAMDVIVCADKVREYNAMNGYKIRIYQNYAHLYRNSSPDGVSYNATSLGTATLRWPSSRKVKIRLLMDKKKATVSMLLDGKLVKTWRDPNGFIGGGGALGFNPQLAGKMEISSIQLKSWNGQIPSSGNGFSAVAGRMDQVQFSNGDNLSGSIISIKDDNLSVKTAFAEVPVPLGKVSSIVFAGSSKREEEKTTGAKFTLGGIGRITGSLIEWNERKVRIKSPLFGDIEVHPTVITSIVFR